MSKFNKAYDAWKEAEEEENRVFQRGGYASEQERREAEAAADDAYSAVADVVYGHGGPRPNSGGARPNSGPQPESIEGQELQHKPGCQTAARK